MVRQNSPSIVIDLNHFKLSLRGKPGVELTLHFNTPSRKFYLSVIALVVYEMKKRGEIISIPLKDHHQILTLLNETVGDSAGSSDKEQLLYRIYRKWKDALPDLERAPLFHIVGHKKNIVKATESTNIYSDSTKDNWANLFEYKGSHDQVRLRFSIDRLGAGLDDISIVYGNFSDVDEPQVWESFLADLQVPTTANPQIENQVNGRKSGQKRQWVITPTNIKTSLRLFHVIAAVCLLVLASAGGWLIWHAGSSQPGKDRHTEDSNNQVLPEKPSVAVLPFENMTGDPQQNYFSDGMTEQIITGLSQGSYVNVISRTSSFSFRNKSMTSKQIADELDVQYLLEGSVQRDGDHVRITTQLINGSNGKHIWG